MIGYRYDSDNYFIGEIEVQESPLEPGVYGIPPNTTLTTPPQIKKNEIQYFDGKNWVIKPDYSNKVYYSKKDKKEKFFNKGEEFDVSYTDKVPRYETYFIWDENSNDWIEDETAIKEIKLKEKQSLIKVLLLNSDYIELPSFINRKGKEVYDKWMTYRENLRSAYHDDSLEIPVEPK
jgi:hypothetical protein